jgi:hypothetical protein
MSSSHLLRWSGLAALVGGVLLLVSSILEFVLFGNQADVEVVTTSAWILVQGAYLVAAIFMSLGLVGLYLCQAKEAGATGLAIFILAFSGDLFMAGATWGEAFFGPWLAAAAPELLSGDPAGVFTAGLILSYLLFALGWVLIGLISLRSEQLPHSAALLLIVGAVLFALGGFLDLPFAAVLLGAAIAWMGFALWSGSGEPALIAEGAV